MRCVNLLNLFVLAIGLAPGVHTAQATASATPMAKALDLDRPAMTLAPVQVESPGRTPARQRTR